MRIDQLLNKSVDLIISCDKEGNITEFNPAAEKNLGYSKNEILGKNISIISEETGDLVFKELLKNGVFQGEVVNSRKDGSKFLAYLSANLLYSDNGEIIGSMGVSRDISSEKEIEQRYADIVESASHVIYTIGLDGICTFVNSSVTKFFGYTVDEVLGKPFLEFVYEEDIELVNGYYKNQLKNRVKDTTLEFRAKSKDGSIKWVSQVVNIILSTTESNKVKGFQGIVREIDKAKRLQIKLKKSEYKYMELFNNSTDLMHSIKPDGSFNYVNQRWKDTLGYSDEEIKNLNLFDIIHPDSQNHCAAIMDKIQNSRLEDKLIITYKVQSKDGKTYILEGGLSIDRKKGKVISIQSFLRDVSKQKKAFEIIERQNKEIHSGITYAKNIQESVLPKIEEINNILTDSFLFYKPRDIVSGDFYIVDYIQSNGKVKMPCFIVGDCTGHGVPGAVLSLLCNALTKESFSRKEVNSPAEALNFVRKKLIKFFKSGSKQLMTDGMDAAFCVINEEQEELYFAGAHLSCLIIRNGELKEIKGDKQHIGYNYNELPFTHHCIPIQKDDAVFIYSDGYSDQFGGKMLKKFTKKRLHQLLINHIDLPMRELGIKIEESFYDWKGEYDQVDDITILGTRIQ